MPFLHVGARRTRDIAVEEGSRRCRPCVESLPRHAATAVSEVFEEIRSFTKVFGVRRVVAVKIELASAVSIRPVPSANPVCRSARDFEERRAVVHPASILNAAIGSI